MYWVKYFLEISILAYIFSTITFLIGQHLNKKLKNITKDYLSIANLTILIIVGLKSILLLYQNYQHNHLENQYYYQYIVLEIFIKGVVFGFMVMLSLKKYREKTNPTYIIILLTILIENSDRLRIIITSFNRDYIPSSWTYIDLRDFYEKKSFHVGIMSFLYLFVCYTIANSLHQKKVNIEG